MGVTNFDVVRANMILGPVGMGTQGKVIHVRPGTGADGQDGLSPESAVKTLVKALALATANQNDIVLLYSESNTSADTTDYQSATLDWNKDMVHLIGIGAPSAYSNRARVAQLSTATGVSPLFKLSADSCQIHNVSFFHGVADATSLICFQITGTRNVVSNCHIAGVGNATMSAAGAASLQINGGSENLIKECTIGLDTIDRDADTSEITFDTSATKNLFVDCLIQARIGATAYTHVKTVDSTSLGGLTLFKNCLFHSWSTSKAFPQTQIMSITAGVSGQYSAQIALMDSYYATDDASCVWATTGVSNLRNNAVAAAVSGAGGEMTIL